MTNKSTIESNSQHHPSKNPLPIAAHFTAIFHSPLPPPNTATTLALFPHKSLICPSTLSHKHHKVTIFICHTRYSIVTHPAPPSSLTVLIAEGHDPVHLPGIVHNMSQQVLHIHPHIRSLFHLQAHWLVLTEKVAYLLIVDLQVRDTNKEPGRWVQGRGKNSPQERMLSRRGQWYGMFDQRESNTKPSDLENALVA